MTQKTLAELKKKRTTLRRKNTLAQKEFEKQQAKIKELENNYESNKEVQTIKKEIRQLEIKEQKLRERLFEIKNKTATPTSEQYRKKDRAARDAANAKEELQNIEKQYEALTKELTAESSTEEVHNFLKNSIQGNFPWMHEKKTFDKGSKDGTFYKKQELKNGITIYHAKADDYEGFRSLDTNRYFAFKEGNLVGFWKKRKSRHPGDYVGGANSWVAVKNLESDNQSTKQVKHKWRDEMIDEPLTFNEWKDELRKISKDETPTSIAFTKDNISTMRSY